MADSPIRHQMAVTPTTTIRRQQHTQSHVFNTLSHRHVPIEYTHTRITNKSHTPNRPAHMHMHGPTTLSHTHTNTPSARSMHDFIFPFQLSATHNQKSIHDVSPNRHCHCDTRKKRIIFFRLNNKQSLK